MKKKNIGQFINIDGIGETQINSIEKFFKNRTNINVIKKLVKILKIKEIKINKKGKFTNKNFMFTGKLINISRAEAKSLVEKNSGSIVSSVNKKLSYLVIGEKPTNRKVQQAKELNIKILNQQDWLKMLN